MRLWSLRALALCVLAGLLAVPAAGSSGAPLQGVRVVRDRVFAVRDGQPLRVDVYLPARWSTDRPAAVLVHGGGFRVGNKHTLASRGMALAARGWVAFSVEYRLAAAAPHVAAADVADADAAAGELPAPVADVADAVRWVRQSAGRFGIDPRRVVALGDSAGGTLVGMLATLGEGRLDRGARVAAAVSWSGPQDLRTLSIGREATELPGDAVHYLGCEPAACAGHALAASPLGHVDPTDAPMLLANSTEELVPLDQATSMGAALGAAGVEQRVVVVQGRDHGRHFADRLWAPTVRFLEAHVGHVPA